MAERYVGIDLGTETVKVAELVGAGGRLRWRSRVCREHGKEPGRVALEVLRGLPWEEVAGAAVCGRLAPALRLVRVPERQARAEGYHVLRPDGGPATLVSVGSRGFSVLELREGGVEVFRENSRCSQGTGNFLRQLVERFGLSVEEASALCAGVEDPSPLSGRCPVILKTDMTHLANVGQSRERILAGLFDAVAENVQVLVKPRLAPSRVLLLGGVARAPRVRAHFERFASEHGLDWVDADPEEVLFLDALGAAALAAGEAREAPPSLDALVAAPEVVSLEVLPALAASLERVRRLPPSAPVAPEEAAGSACDLVLGLDIGSTGSKAVALRVSDRRTAWQGYRGTEGDPVGAAQALVRRFVESPWGHHPVRAVGATGSGREIVGSLLASCYGPDGVYVLNEIAAHAQGARHHDPRVDTVFEIGGQDAKYIRLAGGRVVDAAMNEACSAGTGSFIEEQGRRFAGIRDVVHLGEEAAAADAAVSLGQHCSVFMAEVIDDAVAGGVDRRHVIAGLYDSVVGNYLDRVKGSRSVGQVVFCQGMPFSADALAAAVARRTGAEVIVPPHPGTIGALGIALLTRRERAVTALPALDLGRFLGAGVLDKDHFVCRATRGCGGAGNRCRIERISTQVEGRRGRFTWGGGCSLFDRGTGRAKLPDGAPDPFREREEAIDELIRELADRPRGRTRGRVGLTDEFSLKTHFPFVATYLSALGFELSVLRGADHGLLKRGIEEANVPFCAPMQQFHGLVSALAEELPDILLLPMVRSLPKVSDEPWSTLCPIVQASPDLLRSDLQAQGQGGVRVVSPILEVGDRGLRSSDFRESCRRLAVELGVLGRGWRAALSEALAAQERFEARCRSLGEAALTFCAERGIVPVVVLGRPYTIYNRVLNSNVPAIVREQGAIAVPVDCYPTQDAVPVLTGVFWAHAQRSLRAAHQVRRTPGTYSVWCSNYSCGPDSFALHLYTHAMEGKPYAVIETDGHSGDAGTRTRVEAFLHCVREDRQAQAGAPQAEEPARLDRIAPRSGTLDDLRRRGERFLTPRMGPASEVLAELLVGLGLEAECLPSPDREAVRLGRRHTSGKECVPMCLTLGSLLQRLQGEEGNGRRYAFLMPSARGPCRFGAYNLLLQIVLERLGWGDRVRVWSPDDGDYFRGVDRGVEVLVVAGCAAADALQDALLDAWPSERTPGEAQRVHRAWYAELMALIREAAGGDLSLSRALAEVATGRLFGITGLLRRAAAELSQLRRPGALPTVLVVGEIYVRCEPAANDHLLERLARRGVRAHLAPFTEWLEYQDHINVAVGRDHSVGLWLKSKVRGAVQDRVWETVAERFGWPARTTVPETLDAAGDYLRYQLEGEAVLTLGGPVHEWRCGNIDGAVSVGPLECMPAKVAEAQLFHAAELEGLPSVTLSVHGDPVDPGRLDDFVFEVKRRFRRRRAGVAGGEARGAAGRPVVEVSPVIGDRPARRNGNGVKRAPARRPRPGRPRP